MFGKEKSYWRPEYIGSLMLLLNTHSAIVTTVRTIDTTDNTHNSIVTSMFLTTANDNFAVPSTTTPISGNPSTIGPILKQLKFFSLIYLQFLI